MYCARRGPRCAAERSQTGSYVLTITAQRSATPARDRRGDSALTFAIRVERASGAGGRRYATCYLIVYS